MSGEIQYNTSNDKKGQPNPGDVHKFISHRRAEIKVEIEDEANLRRLEAVTTLTKIKAVALDASTHLPVEARAGFIIGVLQSANRRERE